MQHFGECDYAELIRPIPSPTGAKSGAKSDAKSGAKSAGAKRPADPPYTDVRLQKPCLKSGLPKLSIDPPGTYQVFTGPTAPPGHDDDSQDQVSCHV